MKLLFCLQAYFPHGGLQKDCLRMAKTCALRGHQVQIVTGVWQGPRPEGIPVTVLPVHAWSNYGWVRKFTRQAQAYFQKQKADCVIGFNRMPGLDFYYAADPCYRERFMQLPWHKKLSPRCYQYLQLERGFCATTDRHLFVLTPKAGAQFQQHYGLPDENIHVLPPSLDEKKYTLSDLSDEKRLALKQHYGLSENDQLILLIGSAFKTKGLDRALKAIASLPASAQQKLHFWVVGQDSATAYQIMLKKLAISAQVKFLGGRDDVPELLQAADLLLHPAYTDNTGTVILEAMASALPVLTTDVCGFAKYVAQAQAGQVIATPFEQKQLNDLLLNMLTNDNETMRQNGLTFCQQTDIHNGLDKAISIIEKHHPR